MPILSVIICAYNAADTLKKAALSILSQSFSDLELIIVNDGSKDSTLSIASELAMKDTRVKVISKENGGVARARNLSLDVATGEFITFVDADDYLDDGALAEMYKSVVENGSDMLIAGYFHETILKNGISRVEVKAKNAVYTKKQELYPDFVELKSKYLIDAMCNKLFKRSVIAENGLRFPEGELFEDTEFNLRFLEVTSKLCVIDKCFYHYIQYPGAGITRGFNPKKAEFLTDRYSTLMEFCRDANEDLKGYCHTFHIRNMFSVISGTYGVSEMTAKQRTKVITDIVKSNLFKTCAKSAKATSRTDKVCLAVAKSGSIVLIKAFCKAIFILKQKAAVTFTKYKR